MKISNFDGCLPSVSRTRSRINYENLTVCSKGLRSRSALLCFYAVSSPVHKLVCSCFLKELTRVFAMKEFRGRFLGDISTEKGHEFRPYLGFVNITEELSGPPLKHSV